MLFLRCSCQPFPSYPKAFLFTISPHTPAVLPHLRRSPSLHRKSVHCFGTYSINASISADCIYELSLPCTVCCPLTPSPGCQMRKGMTAVCQKLLLFFICRRYFPCLLLAHSNIWMDINAANTATRRNMYS